MKNYKVVKTMVGPFPKDRVISAEDIREENTTPEKLLKKKSVVETDEPLTSEPLPLGPHNETELPSPTVAPGLPGSTPSPTPPPVDTGAMTPEGGAVPSASAPTVKDPDKNEAEGAPEGSDVSTTPIVPRSATRPVPPPTKKG